MQLLQKIFWFLPWVLITSHCKIEPVKLTNESLTVRVPREPDILNPILSNTAIAATIENLLFLPLMDFDPYTQEIKPVLTSGPTTILHQGNNTGYKILLRDQAVWDDGTPVTVADVVFSLKAILNPFVSSNGKRGVIYPIDSIETFTNTKELIFWTDDKIIAVATTDPSVNYIDDISVIPDYLEKEIIHFFDTYKILENKKVTADKFQNKEIAFQIILEDVENYKAKYKKD